MATYVNTDILIDNQLVCEKLAAFSYARYTVEFCVELPFLWYSQVQDQSGGWREIYVQKRTQHRQHGDSHSLLAVAIAVLPVLCMPRRHLRSHCQHARAVRSRWFAIRVLVLSAEERRALLKLLWGLVHSFVHLYMNNWKHWWSKQLNVNINVNLRKKIDSKYRHSGGVQW